MQWKPGGRGKPLAVAIEFVNVIVRKAAVESRFPGGLDGFARQDLPNLTEDDHLLRVGFMSGSDAFGFVSELEAAGLDGESDIAVVVGSDSAVPPWLSAGLIDGHPACWASNFPAGEVAWPELGFMFRCPRAVYELLPALIRQCGAEAHQDTIGVAPETLARLRCIRGDAEITIEVFGRLEGDAPVGLWGRRQLARRAQFRADVALIRDLTSLLDSARVNSR
jgi:hypothetical protein